MCKLVLSWAGLAAGFAVWSLAGCAAAGGPAKGAQDAARDRDTAARFDSSGALLRPQHFETWVFVGSSAGLSYEPGMKSKGIGEFHDVYLRPQSYREYARTGKFPEKTVLVLALYSPKENTPPLKAGYFEGDLEGMAAAVKDHERFSEGWAYFSFGEAGHLKDKASANPKQMCFSCHQQHAADDNVFVQFYPILRPILQAHRPGSLPGGE
jgi:Cytochrome P460